MADKFECAHTETRSFELARMQRYLMWCVRCGAQRERAGATQGPWTLPAITSDKHFVFLRKLARAINAWSTNAG